MKEVYKKSIEQSAEKLRKSEPKEVDRFMEVWWPEFKETAIEFGFDPQLVETWNPEDLRFYYDQGYGPHNTFFMELHFVI